MRPWLLFTVGLLAGGGLYALGTSLLATPPEPVEDDLAFDAAAFDPDRASFLDKVVVRLDRIERQLDDLAANAPAPVPEGAVLHGHTGRETMRECSLCGQVDVPAEIPMLGRVGGSRSRGVADGRVHDHLPVFCSRACAGKHRKDEIGSERTPEPPSSSHMASPSARQCRPGQSDLLTER